MLLRRLKLPVNNQYSAAFLERQYRRVDYALSFIESVSDSMNNHNGPVDELFKQVDTVYSEALCLLNMLAKATNRVVRT